jgi:hypothetical protein
MLRRCVGPPYFFRRARGGRLHSALAHSGNPEALKETLAAPERSRTEVGRVASQSAESEMGIERKPMLKSGLGLTGAWTVGSEGALPPTAFR